MAKRRSINSRAKRVEVSVQQYLWPNTTFAGNSKRPAFEDQDVCGMDYQGDFWWGEVKNYSRETINNLGGTWKALEGALEQANNAIDRNKHVWQQYTEKRPKAFAVLWEKGSRDDNKRLVMLEHIGMLIVIKLTDFKKKFIDYGTELC